MTVQPRLRQLFSYLIHGLYGRENVNIKKTTCPWTKSDLVGTK